MEISKLNPGYGYVLVEIPPAVNSIKTLSGIELYIETSFEPERYANVWATVVAVPTRLKTKSMLEDRNKMHVISKDSDVRLVAGDKVYFHYLTIKNSKKNHNRGTYFEEDGKRYALLPYASLFFAVRQYVTDLDRSGICNGELMSISDIIPIISKNENRALFFEKKHDIEAVKEYVMLNDWLLIEPVRKGQHIEYIPKYGNIIVDDELSKGGIIVTTDTPYRSSEGIVRSAPAGCGLNTGERIVFEKESDVPVEYDLTRTLDKPYYRMKVEDIIAKRVGDNLIQLVRDYTLIIKEEAEEQTRTGFYIPEVAQKKPLRGEVVMIGPDCNSVSQGDMVVFDGGHYTDFPYGERMGVLVREEKIQAIL